MYCWNNYAKAIQHLSLEINYWQHYQSQKENMRKISTFKALKHHLQEQDNLYGQVKRWWKEKLVLLKAIKMNRRKVLKSLNIKYLIIIAGVVHKRIMMQECMINKRKWCWHLRKVSGLIKLLTPLMQTKAMQLKLKKNNKDQQAANHQNNAIFLLFTNHP